DPQGRGLPARGWGGLWAVRVTDVCVGREGALHQPWLLFSCRRMEKSGAQCGQQKDVADQGVGTGGAAMNRDQKTVVLSIRIPGPLAEKIVKRAEAEARTVNGMVRWILEGWGKRERSAHEPRSER